jgi:hypothetical protein
MDEVIFDLNPQRCQDPVHFAAGSADRLLNIYEQYYELRPMEPGANAF